MIDIYDDPSQDDDGWEDFYNRYQRADEDDPYLLLTTGSTFGGPDDAEDNGKFAFGGGSTLPDGTLNPENYAAFPATLYEKGLVKPGQKIRVKNPATGAVTIVIARDKGPSAKNRGIDLAPHALMELGADTDEPLVVDFRPITELEENVMQPFTMSGPVDMSLSDIDPSPAQPQAVEGTSPSEVFNPATAGITELTPIGSQEGATAVTPTSQPFTPNQDILASAPSSRAPQGAPKIIRKREDGAVEWSDGSVVYPNGIVEERAGDQVYQYVPGSKSPKKVSAGSNEKIIKFGPKGQEKPFVYRDGKLVEVEMPKSAQQNTPGVNYAEERSARVLQSVDELEKKVSRATVGWGGTLLGKIPETDARDFAAEMNTLKANIAFGELTEMRNASKTGGALGQVSNIELGLLESSLGALDIGQSPENLKAQLAKIRNSINRWNEAKKLYADPDAKPEPSPSPTPSPSPQGDQDKYRLIYEEAKRRLEKDPNNKAAHEAIRKLEERGFKI